MKRKLEFIKNLYSELVWNPGFLFGGGLIEISRGIGEINAGKLFIGLVFISLAIPWQVFRMKEGESL